MGDSINFDNAAEFYDATRSLPPEVQARVTDTLMPELAGRGQVLEIGIGTGRIALPLAARGVNLRGVDISQAMLARLGEKANALGLEVPAQIADATQLPFPDDSFDAGIACHIFHLVRDWTSAVSELVRVVRPGGVILVEADSSGGLRSRFRDRVAEMVGDDRVTPDRLNTAEVEARFLELGARVRHLPVVEWERERTVRGALDELASNQWSMTWSIAEALPAVVEQLTREEEAARGDLDTPIVEKQEIAWRAYDLP
ncbi:MAG: class I SAM-dependent methyltransferase [Candidatus Dormibacteraeota bacterium]|nr:class I SAM-dependent methyltransferase [Candidatus Dormibacteraeota bacterium]